MRAKLILVFAMVMGLLTTFLFFKYMKQFDLVAEANVTMVEVVTAKAAVQENALIDSAVLQVTQVPKMSVHAETILKPEEAIGKIAASDLTAGEVLLKHHLRDTKAESIRVARKVQEGYRAVSVGANFVQTVSNLIEPEDLVDVILTSTDKNGGQVTTQLLLEKVRVLAIGRRMVEANKDTVYEEYSAVTLEVKLQDALSLVGGDEKGNLSLVLHSKVNAPPAPVTAPAK